MYVHELRDPTLKVIAHLPENMEVIAVAMSE
jgi:hypothetical protein